MTIADWTESAFVDEADPVSADGGRTNRGILWHEVGPRWGHSMHPMCSYHGMFPAKLVHYFIESYSAPGDTVLDPFSGRGTAVLQARAEGRIAIGSDLSPLAVVLSKAKANPPSWLAINAFLDDLEQEYLADPRPSFASSVSDDVVMLFHPETLEQLCFIRERLLERDLRDWSAEQSMIAGAIAGILHGGHRSDGTSAYLSISMPNTFSMAPSYVEKYIREKGLVAPRQDVFACTRDKLARLYLDSIEGPPGRVTMEDASLMSEGGSVEDESVDLVVTSPPYLGVVNYGTSNWIRLWWLGLNDVSRNGGDGRRTLDAELDHRHGYDAYCGFLGKTMRGVARVLRKDGVAVFVIGDVARPNSAPIALAEQVWADIGASTGLTLLDIIEDELQTHNKVSRIWGDTKGRATERERLLILGRSDGSPRTQNPVVGWSEPYKDGGPDAAHRRVRS